MDSTLLALVGARFGFFSLGLFFPFYLSLLQFLASSIKIMFNKYEWFILFLMYNMELETDFHTKIRS